MLNKKLDGYMNNYVNDMTPLGNVYMRYNNSKKSFEYYSNNTIPYRYLEPVGRKFVLTYFCKPLFIDIEDELNKSKLKKEEHDTKEANKKKEQSEKSEQTNDKKNVFAKLKSYNSSNNQSSNSSEMMKMEKRNVLPPQMKANLPNVNNAATHEDMLLKEKSIALGIKKIITKRMKMQKRNLSDRYNDRPENKSIKKTISVNRNLIQLNSRE
jgi:hypothetical protein